MSGPGIVISIAIAASVAHGPAGHGNVLATIDMEPHAIADTMTEYSTSTQALRRRTIPDSVFTMKHLRLLRISGMDCDAFLPDEHGNEIGQCWTIREIPSQISQLGELEELGLPLNSISVIPPALAQLKRLRVLDLTGNLISHGIENILALEQLEDLSLCGCYLSHLPADLSRLKRLKRLCLAGNNFNKAERARIRRQLPHCRIVF